MDVKRNNAPASIVTRDIEKFAAPTGNVYESVIIIAKRANQISAELKQELSKKLEDFASVSDNMEEIFENREQIEMSRYYEKLPKAGLLAVQEFLEGKIYFRKAESNK
ncbi:MAG: DNA-directed RNA polymerase subunit omega [Prevotellaceae bacterium]|jgi:DNA-directed RNA polymerase subunit K/omega|nr:DNA-directed RNA polymerase subunit omega [Prevotellaceae bacterium]